MRIYPFIPLTILAVLFSACHGEDPNQETGKEEPVLTYDVPAFAAGADLSWASEMESGGIRFKDTAGNTKDLYEILSGIGMNAVRLRVWVNPRYGSWCGKADFLAQARRADQAGMALLMKGRTSFVVAHRLSTIVKADRILVIQNKGIAEEGTHKELMKKKGIYADLYNSQFEELDKE